MPYGEKWVVVKLFCACMKKEGGRCDHDYHWKGNRSWRAEECIPLTAEQVSELQAAHVVKL